MDKESTITLELLAETVSYLADMEKRNTKCISQLSECVVLLQKNINSSNEATFMMLRSLSEIVFALAEKVCPQVSCAANRRVLEHMEKTLYKNNTDNHNQ